MKNKSSKSVIMFMLSWLLFLLLDISNKHIKLVATRTFFQFLFGTIWIILFALWLTLLMLFLWDIFIYLIN